MNSNKNVVNKNENKKTQKIKAVIYDEENIKEAIKLLDTLNVKGIEQCVTLTTIAQRLDSFIKREEIEIEA